MAGVITVFAVFSVVTALAMIVALTVAALRAGTPKSAEAKSRPGVRPSFGAGQSPAAVRRA